MNGFVSGSEGRGLSSRLPRGSPTSLEIDNRKVGLLVAACRGITEPPIRKTGRADVERDSLGVLATVSPPELVRGITRPLNCEDIASPGEDKDLDMVRGR